MAKVAKRLGHKAFQNTHQLDTPITNGGIIGANYFWSYTPEKLLLYRNSTLCTSTPPSSQLPSVKYSHQIALGGRQLESHGSLLFNGVEILILTLCEPDGSLLIAVSLVSGQLIRVVKLPVSITVVTGISHVTFPGLFTHSPISSFTGCVACGCGQSGRVFILDLALGHSEYWPRPNINYPGSVNVLRFNQEGVSLAITTSINDRVHAMVEINGNFVDRSVYNYYDTKNKLIGSFEGATVTALHHFPLASGLLVGYNFGGFQLFSLTDSSLLFSLPVIPHKLLPPVIQFAVQEPDDDPRHYLYVWAVRKEPQAHEMFGSSPSVTMYQMCFKNKLEHVDGTYYYSEVDGCNRRFDYMLWPWYNTSAVMVSTMTLDQIHQKTSKTPPTNNTLITFMCRGVEEPHKAIVTIFDLNTWYNCQMPLHPSWNSTCNSLDREVCPYLSLYQVSCDDGCAVLDGMCQSLTHFKCPLLTDMDSSVESLSSGFTILTDKDIITTRLEGLRSQVVNELCIRTANIMGSPAHYITTLQSLNLLVEGVVMGGASLGVNEMQFVLLSACFQLYLPSVLVGVANATLTSSYHVTPCAMVEWIRREMRELIEEKNTLFDQLMLQNSDGHIDDTSRCHGNRILKGFALLSELLTIFASCVDIKQEELSTLYCTTDVHYKITQGMVWCIDNRLLPYNTDEDSMICEEEEEGEGEEKGFIFPLASLKERYEALEERRQSSGLVIDHLINDVMSPIKGVVLNYPPTDISCILKLSAYPPSLSQQLLILYILMDITTPPGDPTLALSYAIELFETKANVKLAQLMWNIDHGEEIRPPLPGEKLSRWPAIFTLAINRLLDEGNTRRAMSYISVSDGKQSCLHVKVLIAAGRVDKALHILESGKGSGEYPLLLEQFVNSCLTCPHSEQVIKLQLKEELLDDICTVLCDIASPRAVHIALTLLLNHRKNYEAVSLAREHRDVGGVLVQTLADSNLLHPYMESLTSTDLLTKLHETKGVPVSVPRRPFSSVVAKSTGHQFTSNADLLLTLTQANTDTHIAKDSDINFTPFKKTPAAKRVLSSLPFISSSPRSVTRSDKKPHMVATPSRQKLKHFVEQMENFQARMAVLSNLDTEKGKDFSPIISTPRFMGAGLAPPTSILKPSVSKSDSIDSVPLKRRIRFAPEESEEGVVTPPTDDNSDSFHSFEGSPTEKDKREEKKDNTSLNIKEEKGDSSFIAEEEEEEEVKEKTVQSQLQSAIQLTRNSLSSLKITPSKRPHPPPTGSLTRPSVVLKKAAITKDMTKTTPTPLHSSVMVTMRHPLEEYHFSPPSTVAPPPGTNIQAEMPEVPKSEETEFIFSPPLLRSASRERKSKELSQFGGGLVRDTPSRQSLATPTTSKAKSKPLRSVKGRRRK